MQKVRFCIRQGKVWEGNSIPIYFLSASLRASLTVASVPTV